MTGGETPGGLWILAALKIITPLVSFFVYN